MSSTTDMAPLLMTVEQSAQLLAIGRTRMFQLISSGAVDSVRSWSPPSGGIDWALRCTAVNRGNVAGSGSIAGNPCSCSPFAAANGASGNDAESPPRARHTSRCHPRVCWQLERVFDILKVLKSEADKPWLGLQQPAPQQGASRDEQGDHDRDRQTAETLHGSRRGGLQVPLGA
jgi:hypothetical protein